MTTQHNPHDLIVIVTWPSDEDKGTEVFGPFENSDERNEWVLTAEDSDLFLTANFLLTTMSPPIDFVRDDLSIWTEQ